MFTGKYLYPENGHKYRGLPGKAGSDFVHEFMLWVCAYSKRYLRRHGMDYQKLALMVVVIMVAYLVIQGPVLLRARKVKGKALLRHVP